MTEVRSSTRSGRRSALGLTYEHPAAFWLGVVAVTAGTLMQLPMYFMAADMGYKLVDMSFDATMISGMVLIAVGIGLTVYGLFPRFSEVTQGAVSRIKVTALDDAKITRTHVGLILVMAIAITIDVMKPTTLAFVAPGAAAEYGLRSPLNPHAAGLPIALYPLAGITGTVVGSFLWGWLADKMGRRSSILIAAVMFIATSTCGAMPAYPINLAMCFIMGLGVGGMLPIIFSLVSETIPKRHRGWIIVLIGGDVAGAYIIMSWLASTIGAPDRYGWRMLWLVGIPISVILVLLNRWIPESPRFLLQHGREAEATAIMKRYGAVAVEADASELDVEERVHGRYGQLFARPFTGLTAVLVALALGIGIVQYGFQQWIPSNLQKLGFNEVNASKLLRDSALIGFPLNLPIALLYGFWSSKKTIILMATMTAAALIGFVVAGSRVADDSTLLHVLLIVPIWGISSLTAVTAAYASEIYPTRIRARGTGLAAAGTKIGGVLILAAVAAALAAPSISVTAFLGAVPLVAAILLIVFFGVETRKKGLEQITAEELSVPWWRRHEHRAGIEVALMGRRILSWLAVLMLAAGAVVGSNAFSIRDRLLGSALPAPVVPETSRVAVGARAVSSPPRTAERSAPWWQTVTTVEGAAATTSVPITIDPRAIDWRVTWSCDAGHMVVRTPGQPRAVVDANCPQGVAHEDRKRPTQLEVSADGPWRLEVAQRIDTPVVEPRLPAMTAPGARALVAGSFYKVDKVGAGTVTIYDQPDAYSVRLDEFWVSPKDALQLRLSTAESPRTTAAYLNSQSQLLSVLDVTAGSLNYIAPAGVEPAGFRSVVIWSPADHRVYAAARLAPLS